MKFLILVVIVIVTCFYLPNAFASSGPQITIDSPIQNQTITNSVYFHATITDSGQVPKNPQYVITGSVYLDSTPIAPNWGCYTSIHLNPYFCYIILNIDTTNVSSGYHTITINAVDYKNKSNSTSVSIFKN